MSDTRKPMTQEELAEIRELAEAATPGPWYGWFEPKENMIEARGAKWVMGLSPVSCPFTESLIETCGEDVISSFECPKQVLISTDDLEYMVAANPKTVLALLDEVKRLREENKRLCGELERVHEEADWLAESLEIESPYCYECEFKDERYCEYEENITWCAHAPDGTNDTCDQSWRKAARKAIEEERNAE